MKKYTLTALLLAAAGFAGTAAQADKLDDIISSGKLRCAVVLDFPPMGMRDENNEPIGFDVDYCNDLAAALGVTSTHLTRCCQQACGRSAISILQDRRIFEARRLLAETDMPVGQIGESLGFTSPAYFTRAFQHLTGKSPIM